MEVSVKVLVFLLRFAGLSHRHFRVYDDVAAKKAAKEKICAENDGQWLLSRKYLTY